jgi:hypothetical protein
MEAFCYEKTSNLATIDIAAVASISVMVTFRLILLSPKKSFNRQIVLTKIECQILGNYRHHHIREHIRKVYLPSYPSVSEEAV